MISAFGPEVIGESVEGKVLRAEVAEHSGRKYYQFELEPPHVLITATAAGNRLYLFNVTGNGKNSNPRFLSSEYLLYSSKILKLAVISQVFNGKSITKI